MTKPMTLGQRALYDIAVDAERTRNFLLGVGIIQTRAKWLAFGWFVVGLVIGKVI